MSNGVIIPLAVQSGQYCVCGHPRFYHVHNTGRCILGLHCPCESYSVKDEIEEEEEEGG